MNNVNRREVIRLAATAGAVALAGAAARADDPPAKKPDKQPEPVKKPKANAEPAVNSSATAERFGPQHLFAVVDADGNLKRGMHVVSSARLDLGVYEVIFSRDVRRGVYLVTPGGDGYTGIPLAGAASVNGRATDPRGVLVYLSTLTGGPLACGFHLLVVCPEGFA
jgi:hypothetical protein